MVLDATLATDACLPSAVAARSALKLLPPKARANAARVFVVAPTKAVKDAAKRLSKVLSSSEMDRVIPLSDAAALQEVHRAALSV